MTITRLLGYIAERLGIEEQELTFENLVSPLTRERLGAVTFVTATDGNHGRGIAWTAHRIGQKSVVYMPLGSSRERLENIRSLGAEAAITDMNYDDTVRFAAEQANKNGWVLVQDTAWEGYEKIPGWIMQGYMTMALESFEQLRGEKPTHIFLQAGVGSMAGAVAGFFTGLYKGDVRPIITIVEPSEADCIFRTAKADDGRLHAVNGKMNTMMAGLACGEPCSISWDVLNACATHFVSMPDRIAAKGMRVLANPVMDDCRVISGESGAAAFGFAIEVLLNKELSWIKDCLGLESNSKILCFSTEGDTDKENYRRIVWDGYEPS